MTRISRATVLAWAAALLVAGTLRVPSACATEPPTAPSIEEVLKICRENREKLNPLHIQAVHTEERTEAFAKSQQKNFIGIELLLKALDKGEGIEDLEKQTPGISSPQYRTVLRKMVENSKTLVEKFGMEHKYEFFIEGESYQFRSALEPMEKGWSFPTAPLNLETLTKDYARSRIYSRAANRKSTAQIWPGKSSPDSDTYALVTSKHVGQTDNMRFPAFMQAMHAQAHYLNPIDMFFSAAADRYHVVGQEQVDGRLLTIVDVLVQTDQKGSRRAPAGNSEPFNIAYWFRAWLDLDRGGLPIVLKSWYGSEGVPFDEHFRESPCRIVTTSEVKKLNSGAYYPARTVEETFNLDPVFPQLSEAEWAEVRAGTRNAPPNVVFERYTWDCSTVDTDARGDDFFELKFPEGQKRYDLDAGKVIGALEATPPVKSGEFAPPLKVARWLDGKQHSLDEFRGKVVVLDIWGLWCSACRNGVPAMATLQEKFKDKPVVFISIHTAESDSEQLAARIEKFASDSSWHVLAAIDAGTMIEDSATSHAYGCDSFPTQLIIGPEGRVAYNSAIPPPGMEDIVGKTCDQITPEDQVKIDAYEKAQFEAAGEKWPLPKDISQEELKKIANRMFVFEFSKRIEDALSAADRRQK